MLLEKTNGMQNFINYEGRLFPCFYDATSSIKPGEWINDHKGELEKITQKYGGYLLSNFSIKTIHDFSICAQLIEPELLSYTQASTPRTQLEDKIYTSTEFRADKEIPFHNEKSYTNAWPEKIFFFCEKEPSIGGETPIADSRKVLKRISPKIVKRFETKNILYTRRFDTDFDLSWQKVFQTEDPTLVEAMCQKEGISCEWSNSGKNLRTKQICQATIQHPLTGEKVWFNQAHIFHISIFSKEERKLFEDGSIKKDFPRNAYYGDGQPIEDAVLEEIRTAYTEESISFPWKKGDLLILDNILMAHSRKPFQGERKIAVAMA